jgi:carbonic anhydrase
MKGQKLNIIGLVYDIETGLLKSVTKTIKGIEDLP